MINETIFNISYNVYGYVPVETCLYECYNYCSNQTTNIKLALFMALVLIFLILFLKTNNLKNERN